MSEEQIIPSTIHQNDSLTSSERLSLYKFNPDIPEHSELLYKLWNTPLFISLEGKTGVDSLEKAKSVIQTRYLSEYKRNGYGMYLIAINKPNSQDEPRPEYIGTAGLTKGDSPTSFGTPDIGFALLPEYTGQGHATEASKLVLQYVEHAFRVKDVLGLCNPENKASRGVLERTGFGFQGVHDLKCFGGVKGAVYTLPHMSDDLSLYGL
jgi:RimJ/RimL family protein N-acetyltransferase